MSKLIEGFKKYRRNKLPQMAPLFNSLADGQRPTSLFFACSDSRVDPNLVTSALPGQNFIHRSIGNFVPPADHNGISRLDFSEAAAIEFAVEVLGVRDVVIFGHSACGAMQATLGGLKDPSLTPNLAEWLKLAKPALGPNPDLIPSTQLSPVDQLSQSNVIVQMKNAATYPALKKRVADGTVTLHGAWFEVATGEVHYYLAAEKRFTLLENDIS
jgi:carbonic anhydrase